MRTYALIPDAEGDLHWTEIQTDANGFDDDVYFQTLLQVLQLELGESPFWSNFGIAAQESVMQQIWPDFSVSQVQQQFAPYFASLTITKASGPGVITPTYNVNVVTHQGATLTATVEN